MNGEEVEQMINEEKEVYFHEYCRRCAHAKKRDDDYPCADCLARPTNTHSHKPVYFEEVEKDGKNTRIKETS